MAHALVNPDLQRVVPGRDREYGGLNLGGVRVDQQAGNLALVGGNTPCPSATWRTACTTNEVDGKAQGRQSYAAVRRPRKTSGANGVRIQVASGSLIGHHRIEVVGLIRIVPRP